MIFIFYYTLLAHLFADFYLQNQKMVIMKKESFKTQCIHAGIHGLILLPLLIFNLTNILFIVAITLSHLILDLLKAWLKLPAKYDLFSFISDQIMHVGSIFIIVYLTGIEIIEPFNLVYLKIALLILLLIKPIDILIEIIFSMINLSTDSTNSSSRWIGYVERVLYAFLMIMGLQSFVAVFVGVKTAARWQEVQNNKLFGLQFYIGTFISVASSLLIGLLLSNILKSLI